MRLSLLWPKSKAFFLSSNVFPLILTFAILGLLFVLFRMKGVEMNYKITSLSKDIEKVTLENKDLKAKRAKLLSVGRLRHFAKKYQLYRPRQEQVIIVP